MQARPRWRSSSPRTLNLGLVAIVTSVVALGIYHNHVLQTAKAQVEMQDELANPRVPPTVADETDEEQARLEELRGRLAELLAAGASDADATTEAVATARAARVEFPDDPELQRLERIAEERDEERRRLELIAEREADRREVILAAARKLVAADDPLGAIHTLGASRDELQHPEALDRLRAEIALDLARASIAGEDPGGALDAVEEAADAVTLLPVASDRRKLMEEVELVREVADRLEDAQVLEGEVDLALSHARWLISRRDERRAIGLLLALRARPGLSPAEADEVAALLFSTTRAELLRDLVRIGGGRVLVAGATEEEVPPFWLGRHEVTVGDYALFLEVTGREAPPSWREGRPADELPVTGITRREASLYAAWLNLRLPSEAEWQWAAQGIDGRPYPWGGEAPDPSRAHLAPPATAGIEALHVAPKLRPIGERPRGASPYGCLDMAGNAQEWTSSDWNGRAVVRGGSAATGSRAARVTARQAVAPDDRDPFLGFRLAGEVE